MVAFVAHLFARFARQDFLAESFGPGQYTSMLVGLSLAVTHCCLIISAKYLACLSALKVTF